MARYSPYLPLKYHCHLNVEVYKYYFKYCTCTTMLQGAAPGDVGSFL